MARTKPRSLRVTRVKLKGEYWTVTRRPTPSRKGKWGEVDYGRHSIYLAPGMGKSQLTEIVIHELAHVFFPDLDEESVTEFAHATERFLHRLLVEKAFLNREIDAEGKPKSPD